MMNAKPDSGPNELNTTDNGKPATDAERRAAMRRLGPLAILTPPTVMSLLVSTRASAESLGEPPPGP